MEDNLLIHPHDDSILSSGEIIASRFRIIKQLARGSWSAIYKAYQIDTNMEVALKILNTSHENDPTIAERFRREALFVSQLSHINTITFLDYGDTGSGSFFIAMEYLEGQTLGQLLQSGPITPWLALKLLRQICASLAEVHSIGVLHRDLKPDNIFICSKTSLSSDAYEEDVIKVLDFGIAKATQGRLQGVEGTLERLTHKGLLIGTPLYMAPEQILEQDLTPAVDVYALGHILYEMLTGRAAMENNNDDPIEVIMRHVEEEMPPLPEAFQNHALSVVVSRATAKNPLDRFPNATALLDFLNMLPSPKSQPPIEAPRTQRNNIKSKGSSSETLVLNNLTVQFSLNDPLGPVAWYSDSFEDLNQFIHTTHNSSRCNLAVFPENHDLKILTASLKDSSLDGTQICVLTTEKDHPLGEVWSAVDRLLNLKEPKGGDAPNTLDRIVQQGFPQRNRIIETLKKFRTQTIGMMEHPVNDLRNKRNDLISALLQPFIECSSESLLVWCIEDLHLTDQLTLTVIKALLSLSETTRTKLLIVVTLNAQQFKSSTHKAKPLISLLAHQSSCIHVVPSQQARTLHEATLLISSILDGEPVSPALAQALYYSTNGQKDLLTETVFLLKSRQSICLNALAEWSLDPAKPHAQNIPHSIDALLTAKLNASWASETFETLLPMVLSAVAMLHDTADIDTVTELLLKFDDSLELNDLHLTIQEAIRLRFFRETRQKLKFIIPSMRWTIIKNFKKTINPALPEEKEVELIALAGQFLLDQHPSPPLYFLQHISSLLVNSKQDERAAKLLREFAKACYLNFNIDTAIDAFLKSLRCSKHTFLMSGPVKLFSPENSEELTVFLRLGECYAILGDLGLAQDHLAHVLRSTEVLNNDHFNSTLKAQAFLLQGELSILRGNLDDASIHFNLAVEAFDDIGHKFGITRTTVELAKLQLMQGSPQRANTALLEIEGANHSDFTETQIQYVLARSYFQLDQPQQALDTICRLLERLEPQHDPSTFAMALQLRAEISFYMGDFIAATRIFQQTNDLLKQLTATSKTTGLLFRLASTYAAAGLLDDSWKLLSSISDRAKQTHDPINASIAELLLADIYAAQLNYTQGSALQTVTNTYISVLKRSQKLRSSELLFMSLTRLLIACVRSHQIDYANALLKKILGEMTLPGGIQPLNPLFIWLKSTQETQKEIHHQLIDHITKAQKDAHHDTLFLSCFLMSDACHRRQDHTRMQAFMRLACQQALRSGRFVEAIQSRLELHRTGFFKKDAPPSPNALYLGPVITLPLTN